MQRLLDDPEAATALPAPAHRRAAAADAVDRFYTSDVFMHTWDLARATGQDDRLDPQTCAELLAGMEPIEELLRSSGQYGPGCRCRTTPTCRPACSASSAATRCAAGE